MKPKGYRKHKYLFALEKKPICHKELLPLDHIEKIELFLSRENIKYCILTAVKIQVFIFSQL